MINNAKSIKKNYLLNTILQIVLIIVPLITIPYVSRVLGSEKVGDYSYANAMVTYFSLFAIIGSSTYGQRQIAFARDDKTKRNSIFWNIFFFRIITSLLFLTLYFVYLSLSNNLNVVCVVFALNILNVMFDITWFYQGLEDFKQIVLKNVVAKLVNLILIFVFIKNSGDLWLYTLIMCSTTVVGSLLTWTTLKKYITWPKERIHPFFATKDMFLIFVPTIAVQVYTVLDKSMIGWITGSSYANGCYDRAEAIVRLALTVVTSVSAVILPRVANLFSKNDTSSAKEYIYKAYRFVFLLSIPLMLGLIMISSSFIPLFLGPGYEDSVLLLCIFSPLVIFVSLANVTGFSYLIATKQQNVYTIAVSVSAIVNLILNLLLIPRFSMFGAAISSVIAEFLGCSIQIAYCIATKQLSAKKIFAPSFKYLIAGCFMFCILFFVRQLSINDLISVFLMMFIGIFTYFASLFVLQDSLLIKEMRNVFRFFLRKIRKKSVQFLP